MSNAITKITADDIGCWFESSRGHYITVDIIELAIAHGMPDTPDDEGHTLADVIADYRDTGGTGDLCEFVYEDQFAAMDWLNDNIAGDDLHFDMYEGDFMLQTQTWWSESSR